MLTWPKVLLLSSDDGESSDWQELFREHAAMTRVRDLNELRVSLGQESYDALFCGWTFRSGTWNQALQHVQERCPDMPVVVFSRTGDEREWVRTLEAGAFDFLVSPYQRRTVLPVLEQAVTSYEARRYHHADSYSNAS